MNEENVLVTQHDHHVAAAAAAAEALAAKEPVKAPGLPCEFQSTLRGH